MFIRARLHRAVHSSQIRLSKIIGWQINLICFDVTPRFACSHIHTGWKSWSQLLSRRSDLLLDYSWCSKLPSSLFLRSFFLPIIPSSCGELAFLWLLCSVFLLSLESHLPCEARLIPQSYFFFFCIFSKYSSLESILYFL